ncbi:MAG: lytic murein transglycosylase B [Gammaproteobacteria bacterium]
MIASARTASTRILILAACLSSACSHVVKPVQIRHAAPAATQPAPAGYAARPEVQQFIARLVHQDGFDKAWLEKAFDSAHRRDSILAAIAKPYEAKPWYQYKPLFVTPARINAGAAFWDAHSALLDKVQQQYGVSPAIIVAILGVESFYGRQKGGYSVLDALTTLSFDYPPRASFFQGELEQYLVMCREHAFDPPSLMGSYAGAMGAPQFMPDSYRQYAVVFNGQGQPDIWNNWADIIASVAHYFQLHGWQADGLVAVPAALPSIVAQAPAALAPTTVGALRSDGVVVSRGLADDTPAILVPLQLEHGTGYWLGLHNFRVILQYNKSPLYAMAVYDLATRIAEVRTQGKQNAPL